MNSFDIVTSAGHSINNYAHIISIRKSLNGQAIQEFGYIMLNVLCGEQYYTYSIEKDGENIKINALASSPIKEIGKTIFWCSNNDYIDIYLKCTQTDKNVRIIVNAQESGNIKCIPYSDFIDVSALNKNYAIEKITAIEYRGDLSRYTNDINNPTLPVGQYFINNDVINLPEGSTYATFINYGGHAHAQIIIDVNGNIYKRMQDGNNFSGWVNLNKSNNYLSVVNATNMTLEEFYNTYASNNYTITAGHVLYSSTTDIKPDNGTWILFAFDYVVIAIPTTATGHKYITTDGRSWLISEF